MEHIDEFLSVLTIALDTLYYKDQYLINHESMRHTKDSKHISELSISHKLGHYLALLITEYDVDCEYNRNKDDKKIMEKFSKQYSELLNNDNITVGNIDEITTIIKADNVLFVEEYGVTRYKNFEEVLQIVQNVGKKVLGVATYKL